MSCYGVKLSGTGRGTPCGAVASYTLRGKSYCAAHRTIAGEAPGEFVAARATLGRKLVRLAAQRDLDARQVSIFELAENDSSLSAGGPMAFSP